MATDDDRWIYPVSWCSVCKHPFRDREQEILHRLEQRHWQIPAEALCARLVAKAPAPDPAEAQQLREALEAAEARQRKEARDGLS
jgi:hypothetical protein